MSISGNLTSIAVKRLDMKPQSFAELFKRAEEHEDYWLSGAILEFTEAVVREMERQGISRTELARRLGTTPAYVTWIGDR